MVNMFVESNFTASQWIRSQIAETRGHKRGQYENVIVMVSNSVPHLSEMFRPLKFHHPYKVLNFFNVAEMFFNTLMSK